MVFGRKIKSTPRLSGENLGAFDDLRPASVDSILLSYRSLPGGLENAVLRDHYHTETATQLWRSLAAFSNDRDNVYAQPRAVNTNRLRQIEDDYDSVLTSASKIAFPEDVVLHMASSFFDFALTNPVCATSEVRLAAAKMGVTVGQSVSGMPDHITIAKITNIFDHYSEIIKRTGSTGPDSEKQKELVTFAARRLGMDIDFGDLPSMLDSARTFTKEHIPSIATTGSAALIAVSLLSPNLAAANESAPPSIRMSQDVTSQAAESIPAPTAASPIAKAVPISPEGVPKQSLTEQGQTVVVTPGAAIEQNATVGHAGTTIPEIEADIIFVLPPPVANAVPISAEINDPTEPTTEVPQRTMVTPGATIKQDEIIEQVVEPVVVPIEIGLPDVADILLTVPVVTEATPEVLPAPDLGDLTPEQVKIQNATQTIMNLINKNDVEAAAMLIGDTFGDKKTAPTTNDGLLTSVIGLRLTFQAVMKAEGHTDVDYVNNSLLALAILEAVATDETVLQSADMQQMMATFKASEDPYQAKLFAQSFEKAGTALSDDEGALLAVVASGVDGAYHTQIKTMYAYVLLASLTDTEQTNQIQAMKDEEARIAAEAAAAEGVQGASEIETIANDPNKLLLAGVERAAQVNGWSTLKTHFHKALVELNVGLSQMSGYSGNVDVESAGYIPNILERGFEKNPNRGLGFVQYTNYMGGDPELDENGQAIGGRRTLYEAAARAAGFNPRTDQSYEFIKWQVGYIIAESQARTSRDGTGNEEAQHAAISDPKQSAAYFRWNFERPGTPHAVPREESAQLIYEQINGQMEAIKQEAVAAAGARVAAEAAKMTAEAAEQAAEKLEKQNLAKKIIAKGKVTYLDKYNPQPKLEGIANGSISGDDEPCGANINILRILDAVTDVHSVQISSINRHCTGQVPKGSSTWSRHYAGNGSALDFSAIDGKATNGRDANALSVLTIALPILSDLATKLNSFSQVGQQQCEGGNIPVLAGIQPINDACNHLHIDLPPSSDPNLKYSPGT